MRTFLGLVVVCLSVGCTSNNKNHSPDLGCIPGTTECVDSTLARVCTDTGWLAKPCVVGSICIGSDCAMPSASAAPCTPNSKVCVGNSLLTCAATGSGYTTTDCPANTTCTVNGCKGACTVGNTGCLDATGKGTTLLTCADGYTQLASSCPMGTLCINDGTSPLNSGICVKGSCAPDTVNGCNASCGIQGGPSPSPTANNFVSVCTNTGTPAGWQWVATQCTGAATCDPIGADCTTTTKQQAKCVAQCTPGAVRCNSSINTQTCDANGNWGAPVACGPGLYCGTLSGVATCGDLSCVSGSVPSRGACVDVAGVSELQACVNGLVAPSPSPCAVGTCIKDTTPGVAPGSGICAAECQMGDSQCVGGEVQACASNGTWSNTVTACATGTCQSFAGSNGRPSTVCGVCVPGSHKCPDNADIQLCGSDGQPGTSTACTFGECRAVQALGDNACVADCIPGQLFCVGAIAPSPQPGALFPGTSAVATCTANGVNPGLNFPSTVGTDPCTLGGALPTGVVCCSTPNTGVVFAGCRNDTDGNAIGCVTCVGSGLNEEGMVDTRCSDAGGTVVGTAAVQTCKSTNDGWQAPVSCSPTHCIGAAPSPAPGTNTVPAGTVSPICHLCAAGNPCTEASWNAIGSSCVDAGEGGPMSCGATSDCCADACYLTNIPMPAFCSST